MHVLITGANRGIGLSLAETYVAQGHKVTGTYRNSHPDLALEWRALDVTDPASHAALAAQMTDVPVDLLICNAGIYLDKFDELGAGFEAEKWSQTFAANVTGVFLTIEAMLPSLRQSNAPKIAIMASMMAARSHAKGNAFIYRASKAAVANLGFNMATALQPENIAVGVFEPGWVVTDMGGPDAALTLDQSIPMLRANLDRLDMRTSGEFTAVNGDPHPH